MPSNTPNFDAALDKILNDLTPHTRTCKETGESFDITARDIEMFKLLRVPPPQTTWWARTRQKRMFIAGFEFFRRTLPDGRDVVSMFDPESFTHIMPNVEWHSDAFDRFSYGKPLDPAKPFFDQWKTLSYAVPRPAIAQDAKSVNSDYAIYDHESKNCYYTLGGLNNEDLLYADMCGWAKNSADAILLMKGEWCYFDAVCTECTRVSFSERCESCVNVLFSLACKNCTDCFGCTNLRNKKFCFLNEQLTEEEYKKRIGAIDLSDARVVEEWKVKTALLWKAAYRRSETNRHSENVVGDEINDSRDVEGIVVQKSERCYHGYGLPGGGKDCMDFLSSVKTERCYNSVRTFNAYENKMTFGTDGCIDVEYSEHLNNCEHCFGCFGLKHQKFCIFNVQYTEEEYWPMVDAIKTAMLARGEYGEFFPHVLSPHAYNTSHAMTLFPDIEEVTKTTGARWYSFDSDKKSDALPIEELPYKLADTGDDVLTKRFRCPVSGRAFGIVKPELEFHRMMGFALSRVHPSVRHKELAERILPLRLSPRVCDSCGKALMTRIPPTHTAPVYCSECYEAIVLGEKSQSTK